MSRKRNEQSVSTAAAPTKNSIHTTWFLVILFLIGFVWGLRNVWYWEPSKLDFLVPIAFAINALWWVIADARRRGHPIPMLARPFFLIFCQVAIPLYVIWSRGWRGLIWTTVIVIIWIAEVFLTCFGIGYLIFGNEYLDSFSAQ